MKLKTMKKSCLVIATLIFSFFIGDAFADAMIVRGDINIDDGPKISFSAPVGLLQALKTSGISAMVENKEEFRSLIDSLIGELESMRENHLLVLRAKNEVEAHVWVEEVNRDEPMRANFVFVDVAPGKHELEVSLRLPQGIFLLGSFIGNQFVEEHRKDILETFKQMFLIKIKEKERRHKQEPPHYQPQPIEEMHQRISNLRDKIDYLHREGRHDEAEGLEREVQEIKRKIEEMERGQVQGQPRHDPQPIEEMHRRIGNLKEKIDQLRREGRHDEAEGLEREMQEIKRKIEEMERGQPRHDPQPIEEMHRRIGNLKEKIDQLRREGRHDEAERLKREVDDIRRKIEEMERGSSHEQPHQGPSYNSEQRTRIINEAVDNMFKAAQRLHEANMHEQAEQLVREAEKFRREIQK
jgi:hypothetical protein